MSKENINPDCTATPKQIRQTCPHEFGFPSDESCDNCVYFNRGPRWKVPDFTRGGETGKQSKAWRKEKLIHGIPHGDD